MNDKVIYRSIGAEIKAIRPARTRSYEHAGSTLEPKRRQAAILAQRKQ